jgi:hypothetical protein
MEASMSEQDLGALRRLAPPPEDASVVERRRARLVAGIERAITDESRATRSRRWRARAIGVFAVAAAAALAVGGYALTHRHAPIANVAPPMPTGPIAVPQIVAEAPAVHVSNGTTLHEHDALETAASGALALAFPSGTHADVAVSSHVMIDFLVTEEAMSIDRGSMLVTATHDFRIQATAIEIDVHAGATFEVKIIDGHPHVRVDAGEVVVKHDGTSEIVRAPNSWPTPGTAHATHTPAIVRRDPSTLAEQNELLQTALDARRRGDDGAAIGSLDKLIAKYPASPLIQDARVERMRAYERSGRHADAVAEAVRYLADFPSGYAREEAKAIAVK